MRVEDGLMEGTMIALRQVLWKCVSVVSVCALLAPSAAIAKPMSADKVREKIVKRGVGTWVGVEERNGLLLIGRIVAIHQDSFGMQLENYPELTSVMYDDVSKLHFGLSSTGILAIFVGGTAAITALIIATHHGFEASKRKFPTSPTTPLFP